MSKAPAIFRAIRERLLELRADATIADCDGDSPLHAFFEDLDAFDVDEAARLLAS